MRVAAMQMRARAGDQGANLVLIEEAANKAAKEGAELLIAPELALPGYGAGDAMRQIVDFWSGKPAKPAAARKRRR